MSQNGIFASFNFDDSVDQYDYRSIIRAYLSSKKLKTVDAARAIEVSAPFLSQVLNSRRSLPDDRAMLISRWMGFNGKQQKYFLLLVRYCNASVQEIKDSLLIELEELLGTANTGETASEISHEIMAAISRWYHFAILELVKLEGFEPDPYWIAKRLKLQPLEVDLALRRLIRLELLKWVDGTLVPSQSSLISSQGIPSQAIRSFHKQSLNLASQAIEEQSVESREFRGKTFAFNKEQVEEIKGQIEQLFINVSRRDQSKAQDSVYQLSVQLFRLDQGGISV